MYLILKVSCYYTSHNQYLNCKILHGGRFRSLNQTHSECEWNLVEIMLQVQILSPNSIEDQKKVFAEN